MNENTTDRDEDLVDTAPFTKEVRSCASDSAPSSTPATSQTAGVLAGLRELRDTPIECRYPLRLVSEDWPGVHELFDLGGEA